MARIIEYGDGDRDIGGSPSSGYGGGSAVVAILIILLLYLGGFFPWIMNLGNSFRSTGPAILQQPIQPVVETRPIRPIVQQPIVPPVVSGGGNVAYVIADSLNMRVSPNQYSPASYILPRGTRVEYLGESYQEPDGDFWVKVQIQANEGVQIGWVSRRYIS